VWDASHAFGPVEIDVLCPKWCGIDASTRIDITAVGPLIRKGLVPNKKYGRRPTNALYKPNTGGNPATVA
jgi:hypothetical protein